MSELVCLAMGFATGAHIYQRRKYTDMPYITHCAEVTGLVATVPHDDAMLAAAWLHDVIEDCDVKERELTSLFGAEVAHLVAWLTDVSKPEDGNRAERKARDRVHTACSPQRAQTIKLADLISNTRSIVQYDPAFARVYLAEKRLLLDAITGDPSLRRLAEQVWHAGMLELGSVPS